jgi:hypothetical protein
MLPDLSLPSLPAFSLLSSLQATSYWLAPWTISLTALLFSVVWGVLVVASLCLAKALLASSGIHLKWDAVWAIGGVAAGSCLVVCGFLAGVLQE